MLFKNILKLFNISHFASIDRVDLVNDDNKHQSDKDNIWTFCRVATRRIWIPLPHVFSSSTLNFASPALACVHKQQSPPPGPASPQTVAS